MEVMSIMTSVIYFHLFHQGGEDKIMTAGDKKTIVNYKGVKFLLQICYDLRFPVWSKNNFDRETEAYDYDAIIYIANWPESRKQAYIHLLRARAIENQAVVFWVNRIGQDFNNNAHSGDTQILNALGDLLAKIKVSKQAILNYEIDFSIEKNIRKEFKVGLDWDKFKIL